MARSSLKNVCRLLEEATKEVPVEDSFLADLKRSIEMDNEKHKRKPSQAYKPSSLKCLRNMYYQVTGKEQDKGTMSSTLIGICNSGTDIHERVQKYVDGMKDNGIDCEYVNVADYVRSRNFDYLDIVKQQGMETKLYHKTLNMSFLCDGVIRYRGRYYILELKTESIYKWQTRKGVNPEHYNQGTAYSIALGIDDVIFVYINRDMVDMKAFMYHVTDDMKQDLVGKIDECDQYVKHLKVPPMPEDKTAKLCQYCNYRESCRMDG